MGMEKVYGCGQEGSVDLNGMYVQSRYGMVGVGCVSRRNGREEALWIR